MRMGLWVLAIGLVCSLCSLRPGSASAQVDTLILQQPDSVRIFQQLLFNPQRFTNFIFWKDVPRNLGGLIRQPDTMGWHPSTSSIVSDSLAVPTTSGAYAGIDSLRTGQIDRTVTFRVLNSGRVGVDSMKIFYEMVLEEHFNGNLIINKNYTPGQALPALFNDQEFPFTTGVDFGLRISFSSGLIDSNGVFLVGMEDFEGFHMWRGIEPDGSDLTVLGEVSKQEEFAGNILDTLYFNSIIPALRDNGIFQLSVSVPGLGREINITEIHPNGKLGKDEFFWFDNNAFNGFTYFYTVTTFDRDYNVRASRQGLIKFDNCELVTGTPYECRQYLVTINNEVPPQSDLTKVYTVPNPFRSGTTRFTAQNYHNFPDDAIRFVNVPDFCDVKIYTTAGDLVRRITHSGTGNIEWDTRNDLGESVSSGIYLWRLVDAKGNDVYGRIIIIR